MNRFGLGDYSLYPNFWSYDANEYNSMHRRFVPSVSFARTNVITALYADPNNYTNADDRRYSISFVNSVYSGTTANPIWNLGVTNAFFADSVCLVGANQAGTVQFNPFFATNTACFAYFRSPSNTRMSMFAISDDAGTNYSGSNIKSAINFGGNGGSVDILADRFYIARDRKLLSSEANFQGFSTWARVLLTPNGDPGLPGTRFSQFEQHRLPRLLPGRDHRQQHRGIQGE